MTAMPVKLILASAVPSPLTKLSPGSWLSVTAPFAEDSVTQTD